MPMKKIIIVSVVAAALVLLGWFGREAVGFSLTVAVENV